MAVKFNPSSIGSGLGYATQINQLFSDVQSALQDAVSRTGNGPNAMSADLDLGTNDLLNVGTANLQDLFIEGSKLASLSEMQDLTSDAQDAATEAENWANRAEDDLVPEGDGVDDYSALHWSKKSEGHASTSLSHANDAQTYRDKAQQWANENEDVEVETGEYSAFHWAEKAKENSDRAVAAQEASGTDTLTASFGLTEYISTDVFAIQVQNTNTGAVTLNLDSLGAKDVTLSDGTALSAGSLEAGKVYSVWYDGTKFIVQDPSSPFLSQGSSNLYSSYSFGTWRNPNASRPVWVELSVATYTDGVEAGDIGVQVDESGGTAKDYSLIVGYADPALGDGGESVSSTSFLIPPGGSYAVISSDPDGNNSILALREFVL